MLTASMSEAQEHEVRNRLASLRHRGESDGL
jgi:hypothetical protein